MSKTNKELAVEVAIAVINANPRFDHNEPNRTKIVPSLGLESIINIITSVNAALNDIDKKNNN